MLVTDGKPGSRRSSVRDAARWQGTSGTSMQSIPGDSSPHPESVNSTAALSTEKGRRR